MKYKAIVIDPPWPFEVWSKATGNGRSAASHYSTMTWERLVELGEYVNDVAADDCALFVWFCRPSMPQALDVIRCWNSYVKLKREQWKYKTEAFTWVKLTNDRSRPATGLGYWTRANTEGVMLFTRGNVKRKAKNVPQVVMWPRTKHSAKPELVQDRIEKLVDGPYLELFARRERKGWVCLGNEISGRDIVEDLCRIG